MNDEKEREPAAVPTAAAELGRSEFGYAPIVRHLQKVMALWDDRREVLGESENKAR
jgi:hypothetical protein